MASDNTNQTKSTTPRFRSPAYPSVSLPDAIAMAERLWNSQRKHEAHFESVSQSLGYSATSGTAQRAIGALGHYGLTEDSGKAEDRKLRLSDLALDLLQLAKDDPRYWNSARVSALRPTINAALWERYGAHVPSDESILPFLKRDKGYSDQAATDVLKNYRETFQFANLGKIADTPAAELNEAPNPMPQTITRPATSGQAPRFYGGGDPISSAPPIAASSEMPIPIGPGLIARIPTNISEDDFDLLLGALNLYKKRIVAPLKSNPENSQDPSFD